MLSSEIKSVIARHPFASSPKNFLGVFAFDHIPTEIEADEDRILFFVVNTDDSSGEGRHWFTIIVFG